MSKRGMFWVKNHNLSYYIINIYICIIKKGEARAESRKERSRRREEKEEKRKRKKRGRFERFNRLISSRSFSS